jgi:hypothetical protein
MYDGPEVLFIKILYFSVNPCVAAERKCRRNFPVLVAPWIETVCRIIKVFEETGNLCANSPLLHKGFARFQYFY